MMELRLRTKRSDEWCDKFKGAAVTEDMLAVKLVGPARILKPNGDPLAVFLPGAAKAEADALYPQFSSIRMPTDNRGYAAGAERVKQEGIQRTRTDPIMSAILGSFEKTPASPSCRLTAYTAKEVEKWEELKPYFQRIAQLFEANVPERYQAQIASVQRTEPDWVIEGTPFTTITVNNTYPTGIHTDKGDLDEGFSTLGCIRRGAYSGGWLTFPQYGVTADMQDGDVLLMDAHEWHGNTPIVCSFCGETLRMPGHTCDEGQRAADFYGKPAMTPPERISIVSYYRTKIENCGTLEAEMQLRAEVVEARNAKKLADLAAEA